MLASCFVFVALTFACTNATPDRIDPEFVPYVNLFFEEAQSRGLNISRDDYSFSIEFGDGFLSGACDLNRNEITISRSHWSGLTELTKQNLVFHEMGHCILDRLHENQVLPHGECKSMMKGAEENECRFNIENMGIWRDYYLDELYKEQTGLPDWYVTQINRDSKDILLEVSDSLTDFISLDVGDINPLANIKVEVTFKDWNKANRAVLWIDGDRIVCFNDAVSLVSSGNIPRYFNTNIRFATSTKIEVVRKEGLSYYLIDGKMFHIEDQLDLPFKFLRLELTAGTSADISDALLSAKVSLID